MNFSSNILRNVQIIEPRIHKKNCSTVGILLLLRFLLLWWLLLGRGPSTVGYMTFGWSRIPVCNHSCSYYPSVWWQISLKLWFCGVGIANCLNFFQGCQISKLLLYLKNEHEITIMLESCRIWSFRAILENQKYFDLIIELPTKIIEYLEICALKIRAEERTPVLTRLSSLRIIYVALLTSIYCWSFQVFDDIK